MTDADPRMDAPPRKPEGIRPERPLMWAAAVVFLAALAMAAYALTPKPMLWDPSAAWKSAVAFALFLTALIGPLRKSTQVGRRGGATMVTTGISRGDAVRTFGLELVRCGALAAYLSAVLLALLLLWPPSPPPVWLKATCADRLRQLGALHTTEVWETGLPVRRGGGAAYVLAWRSSPSRSVAMGQEDVFFCPGDPYASKPATDAERAAYDTVPSAAAELRRRCSYMVRDFARFPLEEGAVGPQIVAADANDHGAHHRGGINILWDDGSVKFTSRAALGAADGDAIVVGPRSTHPELRKLCVVPEDRAGR